MKPASDRIEEAWAQLVEAWGDARRHDAFLELCRREGRLADAAIRYRSRLRDIEPHYREAAPGAEAQRRLSAITLLATQELLASRAPLPSSRSRALRWGAAVLVLIALYALTRALAGG